jgi:hypothetical protein
VTRCQLLYPLAMRILAVALVLLLHPAIGWGHSARTPEEVIAEVRAATARYLDIARAREDGFVQVSGMEPGHGYHFVNPTAQMFTATAALASGTLDLGRPSILLYVERGDVWQLVGVEYALASMPAVNPLPGAEWRAHEASCHYRDHREIASARMSDCAAKHPESGSPFVFWHPSMVVAHVWAWHPNPAGPFAAENRYLAPYGGTVSSHGHDHKRSETEIRYSEMNHRVAGTFLIALAAATIWSLRRPTRAPAAAVLWIVFGLYLFVSSDPEAWPLGPRRFAEIFGDSLVVQHKLLALIPLALGLTDLARRAQLLSGRAAVIAVALLSAVGGASLFYHDHEGGVHLNRIFLQHAAIGLAGLAMAGVLVVVDRRPGAARIARWMWPATLAAVGVLLLFYVE